MALRIRTVLALLVAALVVAGCGTGQVAQTAEQDNTGADAGNELIKLRDVVFVFDGPVAGNEVYGIGETAPLSLTIVNDSAEADRLVAVTSPIAVRGIVIPPNVVVPGGQSLTAGQTGPLAGVELPYENSVSVGLAELLVPIRSGLTYPVTFHFARAGQISLDVPVDIPDRPAPRAD